MKIWTYGEMDAKVKADLDLEDETFIKPNEMIGYYNEALTEAESEMIVMNQDYFLTNFFLPQVQGQQRYALPGNIFANKIRGLQYANGSLIYPISQIRRRDKFDIVSLINQYGISDDYKYLLTNDVPGQAVLNLYPVSRETAILTQAGFFAPVQLWYLRNCARVPLVGEYCNPEVILPSQVDIANDTIQTFAGTNANGVPQRGTPGGYPGSLAYKTGDKIKFNADNGTLPSPLVAGTVYYVIAGANGLIKVAASLINALQGTAIDLTTIGTVYFTVTVAATTAIVNATLIDIPEFATFVMQWVKCRCLEKEGDPRLAGAVDSLTQQRKQLNDTLVKGIDDDDDKIQMDMSFYEEMS